LDPCERGARAKRCRAAVDKSVKGEDGSI